MKSEDLVWAQLAFPFYMQNSQNKPGGCGDFSQGGAEQAQVGSDGAAAAAQQQRVCVWNAIRCAFVCVVFVCLSALCCLLVGCRCCGGREYECVCVAQQRHQEAAEHATRLVAAVLLTLGCTRRTHLRTYTHLRSIQQDRGKP